MFSILLVRCLVVTARARYYHTCTKVKMAIVESGKDGEALQPDNPDVATSPNALAATAESMKPLVAMTPVGSRPTVQQDAPP
jgi:hypothetical protein